MHTAFRRVATLVALIPSVAAAQGKSAVAVSRFVPLTDQVTEGALQRAGNMALEAAQTSSRFSAVIDRQGDTQLNDAVSQAAKGGNWGSPIQVCQDCGWTANVLLIGTIDNKTVGPSRAHKAETPDYEARVGITLKLYDIGTRTVIATNSFTVDNHFCPLPFCPTNDATAEEAIAGAMKALRKPMLAFFTTAIPPRLVTLTWSPDSSTISAVKLNAGKSSGLRRGHRFEVVTSRPSALDPDEIERVKLGLLEIADEDPMSAGAAVVSGGDELAKFFQQVIKERDPKKRPVYVLQSAGKK